MALTAKDPDVDTWFHVHWVTTLVPAWQPDWDYEAGDVIRPSRATGYFYEAETGGRTKADEEGWPTTPSVTRRDGSVVWITRLPVDVTFAAITASEWIVPAESPGLAVVSDVIDGFLTSVLLNGGVAGQSYNVVNRVTVGDLEHDQTITVKVAHT